MTASPDGLFWPGRRLLRKRFATALAAFGSVHRPGRRFVCELGDRIPDRAPDRYAVVIVGGCQLIGARFAFLERLLAIALVHQVGGAPDIDLGYHAAKLHPVEELIGG